jgi:TPP-dependent pyruvate/acetoin dehydrogenase alpha subunit
MSGDWGTARKLAILSRMMIIRRFEERLVHLFEAGAFMAHYHLYCLTSAPMEQLSGIA